MSGARDSAPIGVADGLSPVAGQPNRQQPPPDQRTLFTGLPELGNHHGLGRHAWLGTHRDQRTFPRAASTRPEGGCALPAPVPGLHPGVKPTDVTADLAAPVEWDRQNRMDLTGLEVRPPSLEGTPGRRNQRDRNAPLGPAEGDPALR
jgi:hypothetical protein